MTAQPAHETSPIPQPPARPEELRAALAHLIPSRIPEFDEERARATSQARARVCAAPLRTFTEAWAVEVAIERHPATAARLRGLEEQVAHATTLDEARALAVEISRIRGAAAQEAGMRAVAAGTTR